MFPIYLQLIQKKILLALSSFVSKNATEKVKGRHPPLSSPFGVEFLFCLHPLSFPLISFDRHRVSFTSPGGGFYNLIILWFP